MDYRYNIKITGSGTRDEIVEALKNVLTSIDESNVAVLDGAEWEDSILITEINVVE